MPQSGKTELLGFPKWGWSEAALVSFAGDRNCRLLELNGL